MRRFWVKIGRVVKKVGSRQQFEYDIFLNFCGKDTRKSFTDFVYTLLDNNTPPIRTFRDKENIKIGEVFIEVLYKGIEGSRLFIAVLSENYGYSEDCLRELTHMVRNQKEGQKIIPVFINVARVDVKHQKGSFEEAFCQHEENFDEKTVQEWREALSVVAGLEGFDLQKDTDGHQGRLAMKVFERVEEELQGLARKCPSFG